MNITTRERMKRPAVAAIVLLASSLICAAGCIGGASLRERLDAIDGTYKDSIVHLDEAAAFLEPLALLNVEDAATFEALRYSLQTCLTDMDMAGASLEELGGYDYSGDLEQLGVSMEEYGTEYRACLDELREVYNYLGSLLQATEAYMQVREGMPVLTEVEDPQQWLRAAEELKAACDQAAANLNGIEPPPAAAAYHAYMQELFRLLSATIDSYIRVGTGAGETSDILYDPAFTQFQQAQAEYAGMVEVLSGGLRISGIDPYMENVELEINRLYLEV